MFQSDVVERRLTPSERRKAPAVGVFAGRRCELLRQLCHPVAPAAFLKHGWRQRGLAVHGPPERFGPLSREMLHGLSLPKLLRDTPSEQISVWLSSPTGGNESFKTADAEAAEKCYRSGGSLYFRAPAQAADLLVTALSQQVGLSFGALYADGAPRSEVETFASRAGNVTNWHFDFMENFTLQLSGRKTWRLKQSSVDVPVRGCTPQWGTAGAAVASAAEQQAKVHTQHARGSGGFEPVPPSDFWDDAVEVTVEAGSVLYVPAGMWHRVECVEDSLSINISLMGQAWADLVADAVRQRLLTHTAGRAPICMRSVADGRRQLAGLLALASNELASLAPADLLPEALALPRRARVALASSASLPPPPLPPPPLSSSSSSSSSSNIAVGEAAEAVVEEGGGHGPARGRPRRVRRGTCFRRSPLAVLIRADGPASDSSEDESADESEGEAEGEGGEEEEEEEEGVAAEEEAADGAAVARRAVLRTRCGSREMLASPSDLFVDGGIGEVQSLCYVIHSHFGGEDYASQLRVELMAPPAVVPLLEWCRAAPRRFTARQAWRGARHNGAPDLTFPLAAETLLALERNGFCRRARKACR